MPNSKKQINDILKLTKSQKSYESIMQDVDRILKQHEPDRSEQLRIYYTGLVRDVFQSGIGFRIAQGNKPTREGKKTDFNKIHGKTLADMVGKALKTMLTEKKIVVLDADTRLAMDAGKVRDMVADVGMHFNSLNQLRISGRDQDINILNGIVDDLFRSAEHRDDPHFKLDSADEYHTSIAEIYIQRQERLVKYENMMKRNAFWRFLNRGEIKKTEHFLNTSAEVLAKSDFDAKKHGPIIESRYAAEPYSFMKYQVDMANQDFKAAKAAKAARAKMKQTVQLTVAREKYYRAEELNKNPETSLMTKWEPYIKKYDLPVGSNGLVDSCSGYMNGAYDFDTQRKLDGIQGTIKTRFLEFYGLIIRSSLNKNGDVNPQEILKDAQAMMDIELNHCTVVYDHPEAKPIGDNNVYADIGISTLQKKMKDPIKAYNKNTDAKIPEGRFAEIDSIVEQTVTADREANKKRIEKTENKENSVEINDVSENDKPNVVENVSDADRRPIAIDMPKENVNIELAPIVKNEPTVTKNKEFVQKQ